MGSKVSYMRSWEPGHYWLGRPVATSRRGLQIHFPDHEVRAFTEAQLKMFRQCSIPAPNRIVIVYDQDTRKTSEVLVG
jgi:hypothetical protein